MNPFDLSASELMIWGLVAHLIADWPLQNAWMATNKMKRHIPSMRPGDGMMTPPRMYQPPTKWWLRHPAAYVHALVHLVCLSLVFGWVAGGWLAWAHLLIDTRVPVEWWVKTMRLSKPEQVYAKGWSPGDPRKDPSVGVKLPPNVMDIGLYVSFQLDQVFHIVCIAAAALLIHI